MTIGRAEAELIADVIHAKQKALGRAIARDEMIPCVEFAAEVAVDAMRETEGIAFGIPKRPTWPDETVPIA